MQLYTCIPLKSDSNIRVLYIPWFLFQVHTAKPMIDTKAPTVRPHITSKWKKQQVNLARGQCLPAFLSLCLVTRHTRFELGDGQTNFVLIHSLGD